MYAIAQGPRIAGRLSGDLNCDYLQVGIWVVVGCGWGLYVAGGKGGEVCSKHRT